MPLSQIKANSIDASSSIATTNLTATRIAVGGATANSSYGIFNRYFGNSEIATQYGAGNISGIGAYASEGGVFFDNGTTKTNPIKWQANGYVTKPYQPFVHAYRNTGTDYTTGQTVIWNTVIAEQPSVGANYSTSTGRFTAPITGVYLVRADFRSSSPQASSMYVDLVCSNGRLCRHEETAGIANQYHQTIAAVWKMNAGDYCFMQAGNGTIRPDATEVDSFSVVLLG
jgi:hypothetical protein